MLRSMVSEACDLLGALPEDGAKPGEVVTHRTSFGAVILDPRSHDDARAGK